MPVNAEGIKIAVVRFCYFVIIGVGLTIDLASAYIRALEIQMH